MELEVGLEDGRSRRDADAAEPHPHRLIALVEDQLKIAAAKGDITRDVLLGVVRARPDARLDDRRAVRESDGECDLVTRYPTPAVRHRGRDHVRPHQQVRARDTRARPQRPVPVRHPAQTGREIPVLRVRRRARQRDRIPLIHTRPVRRCRDRHTRDRVAVHDVSQVEQRRPVRVAVERLRHPLPAARDEDRQRIPARPTRPVHDLLNHRAQVGGPLIRTRLAHRGPRGGAPRHERHRARPRRDVSGRVEEGSRRVDRLPFEGEGGRLRVGFGCLELEVGLEDCGPPRNGDAVEPNPHGLVAGVEDQLQIAAEATDPAQGVLLGVVHADLDAPLDDRRAVG